MTWFKVDDAWWSHPKVLTLSSAARALWVTAGSYCAHHLTDGVVTPAALPLLNASIEDAEELCNAGLWIGLSDGWEFHDWKRYQPLKEKVEAEREAGRERAAAWRAQHPGTYSRTYGERNGVRAGIVQPTRPDPSRRTYARARDENPTPMPPPLRDVLADLDEKARADDAG